MTYKMANFVGRRAKTGNRKKQMTKHTAAPKLHAPKTRIRSHRETMAFQTSASIGISYLGGALHQAQQGIMGLSKLAKNIKGSGRVSIDKVEEGHKERYNRKQMVL